MNKDLVNWRNQIYELNWNDDINFKNLDNVTQVYGFLFDKDNNLLIVNPKRSWRLPGGKPEDGESYEDTLVRESEEEADVEIGDLIPIGFIKAVPKSNNCEKGIHYQLRFVGRIKKIKPQTIDVAEGLINERKFIKPENFLKYCDWGDFGKAQLNIALQKLK